VSRKYPVKGRGGIGVKTVQLTEAKGQLAGARVVRDGYQVMLISDGGTVIRMSVDDIKRSGRATQGVIVMRPARGRARLEPRAGRRVGRGQGRSGAENERRRSDGGLGLRKPSESGASKGGHFEGASSLSRTRAVYL
jgi:hypothetical protein